MTLRSWDGQYAFLEGNMKMPTDAAKITRINRAIEKATVNQYKPFIPCVALFDILQREGFEPEDPDEMPTLLGRQGSAIFEFYHPQFVDRDYLLHLSWYKMESGNYEIVSRFEGVKAKRGKAPVTRTPSSPDRQLVNDVNGAINEITQNRYERVVPFDTLFTILENGGFQPTENSREATQGNEGRMTVEFQHPEYPSRRYYLHVTWFRMPSSNFETVARLEATNRR